MADDKQGRDKQAHDADRRQRERELRTELARRNETEPPVETVALDEIEEALDDVPFPATGSEIVAVVGDRTVAAGTDRYTVDTLLPATEVEQFKTPDEVRVRIERPTVATAMKRVVEAAGTVPNVEFSAGKRDAYEKTLRAMAALSGTDDDSGVRVVTDWIVDRVEEKGKLPDSRDVRREGGKVARDLGHEVRNDEWLGV